MTNKPEQLPEWRKSLNEAVENYQSTRAWYEENQDSLSAEQDIDAAAGEIAKLIKQYGVLIVLNLLDEIDELQERRKADSEPVGWTDEEELRDVEKDGCGYLFKANPISPNSDPRRVIKLYRHAQPAPVVLDSANELRPCPFCGGKAHQLTIEQDNDPHFGGDVITCTACGASSHVEFGFKENLKSAWNSRATMLQAGNYPVTPDGWQLVPKEPTQAMNKAGWDAMNEYDAINPTYRAMLAAAPLQAKSQHKKK